MKEYCYKDGKIVKTKDVGLSLNDIGVLRGYAVFDFLRTYNGKVFHLKDHLVRFKKGLKQFRFNVSITEKELEKVIRNLLKKNKCQEVGVRLVATGGVSDDGFTFSKPVFYILIEDIYSLPDKVFKNGAKIITHKYCRTFPELKTTNYSTFINLQNKIKKAKAIEVLYLDEDETVREAATSNIFMFKGSSLFTTKDKVLTGVTRKIVIKLARKNFKVIEKDFKLADLLKADEVFITATNKKIAPIRIINNKKINDGRVGAKTKVLIQALDDYIANY